MELKSNHLASAAVIVLIIGFILSLASGNIFPTMIEKTKHVNYGGMIAIEPYFEPVYNISVAVAVFISSAISALVLWFCSTVLFYLEKNRNFNKKAIELLEKIVDRQEAQDAIKALEQPDKVTTTE